MVTEDLFHSAPAYRDRRISFRDYRSSKYISLHAHIENLNAQAAAAASREELGQTVAQDADSSSALAVLKKKGARQPRLFIAWAKRISSVFHKRTPLSPPPPPPPTATTAAVSTTEDDCEPPSCPWRSVTLYNVHERSYLDNDGQRGMRIDGTKAERSGHSLAQFVCREGEENEVLVTPSKRAWSLRRYRRGEVGKDAYMQFMDKF